MIAYNESDTARSVAVTVRDSDDEVVFADTVDVDPSTDQSDGVELDTAVSLDESYTFEADPESGDGVSKETVVDCGNVYIYVTESGDMEIRDDGHEGD